MFQKSLRNSHFSLGKQEVKDPPHRLNTATSGQAGILLLPKSRVSYFGALWGALLKLFNKTDETDHFVTLANDVVVQSPVGNLTSVGVTLNAHALSVIFGAQYYPNELHLII